MKIRPLELSGALLLEPETKSDRRGFFTRGYCQQLLEERGLDPAIVRCQVAVCAKRGALHGLHWQEEPYAEARLIRVTRGKVFAVLVDLRKESSAFRRHQTIELDDRSRSSLYAPAGVAFGFQALVDGAEVMLQFSEVEHAESARGARWNDPILDIDWPLRVTRVSTRDSRFPDLEA